MTADKSRRAILVYALLAVRTIRLVLPLRLRLTQRAPRHFTVDHGRFTMVAITSQPRMS
jgi:hypothetical protein